MPYVKRLPRSLTTDQVRQILNVTGRDRQGYRDHILYDLAIHTALREHELAALDIGDVYDSQGRAKAIIQLRIFKKNALPQADQIVRLGRYMRDKLVRYYAWRVNSGLPADPGAPMFMSNQGRRLALRTMRYQWHVWLAAAGVPKCGFHTLRHTACTLALRAAEGNGGVRAVQRLARHASVETTYIYTHASDQQWQETVDRMPRW